MKWFAKGENVGVGGGGKNHGREWDVDMTKMRHFWVFLDEREISPDLWAMTVYPAVSNLPLKFLLSTSAGNLPLAAC